METLTKEEFTFRMDSLKEDTKEIKDHMKELNGSVARHEREKALLETRVTVLEAEMKPLKKFFNTVIYIIVGSFLAAGGWFGLKR